VNVGVSDVRIFGVFIGCGNHPGYFHGFTDSDVLRGPENPIQTGDLIIGTWNIEEVAPALLQRHI
jgi:hypothetical protein